MAKDVYYVSHDFNARNDPKCSALIHEYGPEGYGLYWMMIEIMAEQESHKIKKFPKLYEGLARQFSIELSRLRSIIEALLQDYELLLQDDNYIWSDSLIRRMTEKDKKKTAKIEAGRQGGLKSGISRKSKKHDEAKTKQNEAVLEANEPEEKKLEETKLNNKDIDDFFNSIWTLYPRKEGKGQVSKSQKEKLLKIGYEEIERCITRYKQAKNGTEQKFLQQGSTFFNSGYVDYLDANYEESKIVNGPVYRKE